MHENALFLSVVETIDKNREPLPAMEAIYLITPSEKSVGCLMRDFQSQHRTQYRLAHVYFTEGEPSSWIFSIFLRSLSFNFPHSFRIACPDVLFKNLARSYLNQAKLIGSCVEINMAFIPLESQVHTGGRKGAY